MGSKGFRSWAAFVVRHRRATIAVFALLSCVFAAGATRLRLEIDPDRNLPTDHEAVRALKELNQRFGDKNLVVVGLFPTEGDVFQPDFLRTVWDVSLAIEAVPGMIHPLFQSLASPAVSDVRGTGDVLAIEPMMDGPPASRADANAIRERVRRNRALIDTLVSRNSDAVAIYATFDLSEELPSYEALYERVRDVVAEHESPSVTYALSGPVVLAGALGLASAQIAFFLPIAVLLIGWMHYRAFRTWQAMILPLATAILAVIWAVGAMGLLDVPLDPFTTTTPILILAVAAGHAVQILKRFYEEYARLGDTEQAVIESIAQIGPVMMAAGTIAALALLSLTTFDLATVRAFGLFGALGVAASLLIELTLIPAVRASLSTPRLLELERERSNTVLGPVLDRTCAAVLGDGAKWILLVAVGVLVVCGALATRVGVDSSFKRSFEPGSDVYDQDERLNETFAGTNTLVFLVEGPDRGSILEPAALEAIDAVERRMEGLPGVGRAFSVVDRLRHLNRELQGDPEAGLPTPQTYAQQLLLLYEAGGGSAVAEITPDTRIAKVVVLLRDDSTRFGDERIADARTILEEELPDGYSARIAGTLASNAALTNVIVAGKLENIAQVALVTFLVASFLFRNLFAGALIVVPLGLAVAVDFGVMGAVGMPLDIVTASVAALAVGIGADYATYFLFRLREESQRGQDFPEALRATYAGSGRAIVFVASAISAGYASLCLSSFSVHRSLGALVALAMIAASTASLTVLPVLLRWAAESRLRSSLVGNLLERPSDRA